MQNKSLISVVVALSLVALGAVTAGEAAAGSSGPGQKVVAPARPHAAVPDGDPTSNLSARIDGALSRLDADAYAGVDVGSGTIRVHRLASAKAKVQADTDAAIAAARKDGSTDGRAVNYVDASNTMSAMLNGQQWILSHHAEIAQRGIHLADFGPNVSDNKLRIGVINPSSSDISYFVDNLGADLVSVVSSPSAFSYAYSRNTDIAPWFGGDYINGPNQCTSGYPAVDSTGVTYNTTAGHCGSGTWYQNGQGYGTTIQSNWYNGGSTDAQIISTYPASAYGAIYFDCKTCNAGTPVKTYSLSQSSGETGICADGYQSAPEHCGGTMYLTNQCVQMINGWTLCGMDEVLDYSQPVQGGDSGGPVYNHINSGQYAGGFNVRGLIVGYSTLNQAIWIFTPASQVQATLGVTPLGS